MGFTPTKEELNALVLEIDEDGSGLIEIDEFVKMLQKFKKLNE